ncbi:MAG TPA: PIN domain-containing protein [Pyrinomonadaceae bacterium]|jgi:predicted nucleic acid-binding protein
MTAQYFIDTNVLIYAGSGAEEDQAKKAIARQVLSQASIGFSAQVMQEFYYAAISKERLRITHEEAIVILEALNPFPVLPINRDVVLEAVDISVRHRVSYWDAAIIAAARQLGCDTLYSEDLSHGQNYDGVKVVNPFLAVAPA